MSNFLFYLGFSVLIAHEMDAIAQSEWRLLFIFRKLPEQVASRLFIGVHIPVVALLMWLTGDSPTALQPLSRGAIALFLMIHTLLHKRLEHHPHYTFHSPLSKSLIYGGGLLGLLYCVTVFTAI